MAKRKRCSETGKFLPSTDINGTTPVFLRLPSETAMAIKDTADRMDTTMADLVAKAVNLYLENEPLSANTMPSATLPKARFKW